MGLWLPHQELPSWPSDSIISLQALQGVEIILHHGHGLSEHWEVSVWCPFGGENNVHICVAESLRQVCACGSDCKWHSLAHTMCTWPAERICMCFLISWLKVLEFFVQVSVTLRFCWLSQKTEAFQPRKMAAKRRKKQNDLSFGKNWDARQHPFSSAQQK